MWFLFRFLLDLLNKTCYNFIIEVTFALETKKWGNIYEIWKKDIRLNFIKCICIGSGGM